VLDRERILAKLDDLDGYLRELREVVPASLQEYCRVEKKRSCERLLQIAIESSIDICNLFVSGLRLGLPARTTLSRSWNEPASSPTSWSWC